MRKPYLRSRSEKLSKTRKSWANAMILFTAERKKPFRGSVVSDVGENEALRKEKLRVQVTLWVAATFRKISRLGWHVAMISDGKSRVI